MDPELNPFKPGAGLKPPALEGRQQQLTQFDLLVARSKRRMYDRGLILSGLRGVGKTTLLNTLQGIADHQGWLTVAIEARPTDSGTQSIRRKVGQELVRALRSYGQKNNAKFVEPLMQTANKFSVTVGVPGLASVSFKPEDRATSGDLDIDLEELIEMVSLELKTRGSAFGLFIDEMQDLNNEFLSALLAVQHRASQQEWPFFLVGAGLPNLSSVLAENRSYAERQFSYNTIGPLNKQDAAEAFRVPVTMVGGQFMDDSLDILIEASGGYPYFIQEFGHAVWNVAPAKHIMPDDAYVAVEEGRRALDEGFFPSRWDRATDRERRYMRAMAESREEMPKSGRVATLMGTTTPNVGDVRDSALKKGLIWAPEYGRVAFTVPGMAEFIRRTPEYFDRDTR